MNEYQAKEATQSGADRPQVAGRRRVLQALEISESTYERWRDQYGGMKSEETVRLKKLEEDRRLKQLVADLSLDIQMLVHITEGNW